MAPRGRVQLLDRLAVDVARREPLLKQERRRLWPGRVKLDGAGDHGSRLGLTAGAAAPGPDLCR